MAVIRIDLKVNNKGKVTLAKTASSMKSLSTETKKAQAETKKLWDTFLKGAGINPAMAGLAGSVAAVGAAITAATVAVKSFADYGSKVVDMAAKLQTTAEAVQRLQYAGSLVGVTMEQAAAGVVKMQKAISTTPEKLTALGLSIQELRQQEPDKQFQMIGEALARIADPADRAAAAISVFGKSGADLLPLLTSNMREASAEAERLGLIMSGETAAGADALGDAMTKLGAVWEMVKNGVGGVIAGMTNLTDVITVLAEASGALSSIKIPDWVWKATPIGMASAGFSNLASQIKGGAPTVDARKGSIFSPGGVSTPSADAATRAMDEHDKRVKESAKLEKEQAAEVAAFKEAMFAKQRAAFEKAHAMEARILDSVKAKEEKYAADRLARREEEYQKELEYNQMTKDAADAAGDAQIAVAELEAEAHERAAARSAAAWENFAGTMAGIANLISVVGSEALANIAGLVAGTADMLANAAKNGGLTIGDLANQAAGIVKSGSVAGGALSGGMTGLAVGGPVGGIIGAAVGGLLGLFGRSRAKAEELKKRQEEAQQAYLSAFDQWKKAADELANKGADATNNLIAGLFDENGAFVEGLTSAANAAEYVAATFAMLRAQGFSTAEALAKLKPALDKIRSDPQFAGGAADSLIGLANAAKAHKAALDFVSSLGILANALAGFGMLTQELATKMSLDMGGAIQAMIDAHVPYEQALALNAQALYDLQQAAKQSGVALDGNTQAFIDAAEAAGMFEGLEDPMDALVAATQALVVAQGELIKLMGGQVPAAIQAMIDEFNRAANAAHAANPAVPGAGDGSGDEAAGGPRDDGGQVGERAMGGPVFRTGSHKLHAGERVLNEAQAREYERGGRVGLNLSIVVNGASDPRRTAEEVAKAIERRIYPRLNKAVA